jgi:hypothetical protein
MFAIGYCRTCDKKFAVAVDPSTPRGIQWLVYDYEDLWRIAAGAGHSHVCAGAIMCMHGHDLEIGATEVALTKAGAVLSFTGHDPFAWRN